MSKYHAKTGAREWRRIREEAFRVHGRACTECGKYGRMEVHHVQSLQHGGGNEIENLRPWCRSCHIAYHNPPKPLRKAWQDFTKELRLDDAD